MIQTNNNTLKGQKTLNATPIQGSIEIVNWQVLPDGDMLIEIARMDYDHLKTLPAGILHEDVEYGRTGWDSDRCRAFYKSSRKFARRL